jgi:hypothetical protein
MQVNVNIGTQQAVVKTDCCVCSLGNSTCLCTACSLPVHNVDNCSRADGVNRRCLVCVLKERARNTGNAACSFCCVCVNFVAWRVFVYEATNVGNAPQPATSTTQQPRKKSTLPCHAKQKLCSTNSPPTARVRRADEGSDDDIDDKVDVDDDALTEAAAGDSIGVDDNDDVNDDDIDNDGDKDNDELEVLVDVKKLNTKMSAADKREMFAKVMSEQHNVLDRDVLAGAWAMLKPAFKKKFQKTV